MSEQPTKTFLTCAETARLVRAALKAEFPGQKFSVRSSVYAGGASIDVVWTDGPTERQVQPVVNQFAGGRFDGMIDMAYYVSHWYCPEHGVTLAHSPGTEGQRGLDPAYEGVSVPCLEAVRVHLGADYVFTRRRYSDAFRARMLDEMAAVLGAPLEMSRLYEATVLPSSYSEGGQLVRCRGASEYGSTLFHQYTAVRSGAGEVVSDEQ